MAQTSPGKYTVYAVSWDGRLRQVNLADGQDLVPPQTFIPGGGKPYALNLHDGVIYTATAQGCGGLTNALVIGGALAITFFLFTRFSGSNEKKKLKSRKNKLVKGNAENEDEV